MFDTRGEFGPDGAPDRFPLRSGSRGRALRNPRRFPDPALDVLDDEPGERKAEDRRRVRMVIEMLSPEDRRVAQDFMELLSWQKVAARRGMSEGTFRRRILAGFIVRFKAAWGRIF